LSRVCGYQNGFKNNAFLCGPTGIFGKDSDYLIVADYGNGAVRKIELLSGNYEVTTIVGKCTTGCISTGNGAGVQWMVYSPHSVFILENTLYFSDANANCIFITDLLDPVYNTRLFFGTVYPYPNPTIFNPTFLFVNSLYLYYFSQTDGHFLTVLSTSTGTSVKGFCCYCPDSANCITPVDATVNGFGKAQGISVSEDNRYIYFAESLSNTIRILDVNTNIVSVKAGTFEVSGDDGLTTVAATNAKMYAPTALFVKGSKMYFTDILSISVPQGSTSRTGRIRVITHTDSHSAYGVHTHRYLRVDNEDKQ
jgi:DNA-binding beta-propeller fold protein YncE